MDTSPSSSPSSSSSLGNGIRGTSAFHGIPLGAPTLPPPPDAHLAALFRLLRLPLQARLRLLRQQLRQAPQLPNRRHRPRQRACTHILLLLLHLSHPESPPKRTVDFRCTGTSTWCTAAAAPASWASSPAPSSAAAATSWGLF